MIRRPFLIIIVMVSLSTAMTSSLCAQSPMDMQRLRTAETMTYAGRCVEAIVTLRELYNQFPNHERIAAALKNAYVCSKDYDSAILIVQKQVETAPNILQKANFQLEVAGLRFRQGDVEGGKQQIDLALQWVPNDGPTYERAADVLMSHGYYSDAIKFLQESRSKLYQPNAFARKMAMIYEIMRNYGEAAREYFSIGLADSSEDIFISGRIANLIKLDAQEEFDTGLASALSGLVRLHPNNLLAHRFYGDYLISQGRYDDAFQRFQIVDSLENGKGKNLLYFARVARTNGAEAMVERACNQIASIPDSPALLQSRFILAESKYDRGLCTEAASIYKDILNSKANDRDLAQALYALGVVTLYGLHDPKAAIETFDILMQRYGRLPMAASARMLTGDCQLSLGNALLADSIYALVNHTVLPPREQEELMFKRAELQFYTGNFEAAREAYSKVMNAHPKSVFVNDCLRRIMLISEYSGMEEATLQIFAAALYSRSRFDYQATLAELGKLKYRSGAILPELAWLESGSVLSEMGQDTLALAELDSLIARYPESFYTPIALERKGDIFADTRRNCEQARTVYQQVLLNFPNSLNVEEVRKKLLRTEKFICSQVEKAKS